MSNIRRRVSGRSNASGPKSIPDDLEAYADYFSEILAANSAEREVVAPYVILSERHWLSHDTISGFIRGLPNNKAPGVGGIAAEIVKLGGEAFCGATLPLYRAILRSGIVPEKWNVAGLHLIWKQKGPRDDVGMHRPIALTLVFRKILEEVLLSDIHGLLGNLDGAQGGFRKKRSTLDLALALDTVDKEYGRRGKPCYQAFLDIKGA